MPPRNSADDHVQWLKSTPDYRPKLEREYREAQNLEQVRIAEDLRRLYDTAGVLVVDAQGHGIIFGQDCLHSARYFPRPNVIRT
jgi:hypothetical protein